ncbi:MAG: hypothetical protein AAFW89_12440 [Bacteroidota bacterium]
MKHNTIARFTNLAVITLFAALSFTACDNSSDDDDHEHADAEGFVLRMNGQDVVTQLPDADVTGGFTIAAGEETPLITIQFIDHDGDFFQPEGDEYSLRATFSTPEIAEFEQHEEDGTWSFHIHAEAVGTTNMTLQLYHNDHSDFDTQEIAITVTQAVLASNN